MGIVVDKLVTHFLPLSKMTTKTHNSIEHYIYFNIGWLYANYIYHIQ
jgi:hypothetical protein